MNLEPNAGRRSTSPGSSGRASPISRKWARQLAGEEPVTKDKAYRRYASGVDRSLSLFDTTLQEWADYISFLGRLLKSLQAHPSNIAVIPSKNIVARRLAQCLNPGLPSGVHQKALELYNFIFSLIGRDSLSRDLPIYLPGLSSTLSFASLNVRSLFLALLETHLLSLDPTALRPALKAIILALLPGLEEETSEDFERTLKLVDGFKLAVRPQGLDTIHPNKGPHDEYFWQCFFLASITGNNRRAGALAYLARSLPKLGTPLLRNSLGPTAMGLSNYDAQVITDQMTAVVTSPEPGLLIRCFAAGLSDDQILIQRGYLDLLGTHLPLHAKVLQNLVKQEDLELLLIAASGVVSRRDMSLNRRLWAWLLGPEPSSVTSPTSPKFQAEDSIETDSWSRTQYFEQYGLKPLTRGILKMINRDHCIPLERARPFRICLSLMDRWEIGGLVVPEIFLPVVRNVQRYQKQSKTNADFHEVLRSASMFFDGVESGLIWGEIIGLITTALGTGKLAEALGKLSLAKFVIANFNIREEEMLMIHAPLAALTLLVMLENPKDKDETGLPTHVSDEENSSGLATSIAMDLIELIPDRAFYSRSLSGRTKSLIDQQEMSHLDWDNDKILEKVQKFYVLDQGNLEATPPPLPIHDVCYFLVRKAGRICSRSLEAPVSSPDIATKARLLVTVLNKSSDTVGLHVKELFSSIHVRLSGSACLPFSAFTSIISLVTTLYPKSYMSKDDISTLVDPLVRQAWSYLSASQPKYHVETARSLWQLQTCLSFSNHEIEAAICNIIIEHEVSGTFSSRDAGPGRSFAILWTHSLQDSTTHLDRRESRSSNGEPKVTTGASGIRAYEVMLSRPLFLLLDSLLDEKTQLFVTVRTWLQNLVGIEKFFYLFASKFASFFFLKRGVGEDQGQSEAVSPRQYSEDDDLDQCHYYLEKLLTVLKWSPDTTWAALARNNVSTDKADRPLSLITGDENDVSFLVFFVCVCLRAISGSYDYHIAQRSSTISQLHRTALSLLHQILLGPYSTTLSALQLQDKLIARLQTSLDEPDPFIQVSLLDVVFAALKLNLPTASTRPEPPLQGRNPSLQDNPHLLKTQTQVDPGEREVASHTPPASLVKCFQAGFATPSSRPVLDSWINFLSECLPFYAEAIFQIIIPLVETFCTQIERVFQDLQTTFRETATPSEDVIAPETTLISLLNGLEQVLARGHERLAQDEAKSPIMKSPDQPQGFFGNMVSGVFSSDAPQARSLTANNRLTILLSFQDAVRICFKIWSWGGRGLEGSSQDIESAASFTYTSLRMRNRARRLLEHLFAAEPLECLETVIEIWQKASKTGEMKHTAVFNLLHVLDGSRPKHTMPAIFDAMYSRTNPNALEPSRKSTLTSTLLDVDLAIFLVEYARSLEDDAMDEIWTDCMTFLRDILANPFPHRQALPSLLDFAAILGEKVDNTTFGEQKRMRRELGDLFLRLLTATFTTKPIGFSESTSHLVSEKSSQLDERSLSRPLDRAEDVIGILATITPILPAILVEADRVSSAVQIISTSVIGPTLRSKAFPENITKSVLALLYQITRLSNTQKIWKKDLGDAFNDTRFFSNMLILVESDWLPLLRQWVIGDKERMPELLSRISPPTTAGIVFGVGATSARLEADRKTQLNLRRIATLILAATDDAFVTDLATFAEKLVELISATTTSSPSSTTRGEIYMVIRALVLKTSPVHLAFLWPTVNAELYAAISSVVAPDHSQSSDTFNNFSILQACKLLDTVLCIEPDDFQLHEWLFITDTIDAVYRPSEYHPTGLIDGLSEELGSTATASQGHIEHVATSIGPADKTTRMPLLGPGGIECQDVNLERKDELVGKVLRPFFSQLSIFAFERTYEMGRTDWDACRQDLLKDIFSERGVVKAL